MNGAQTQPVELSIVIAAWNDARSLRDCLCSLREQVGAEDEVIVVSNYDDGIQEMIKRQLPFVQQVRLHEAATVLDLRADGVQSSSGKIVALLEDICTFGESWCAEIKKAHELPYAVVGGTIENSSRQSPLDWAVYFYDYGKYMLPERARVVTTLSGANVSYKRGALEEVAPVYHDGFYENFIHDELQRRGHTLYLMPSAVVYHNKNYSMKDALTQSYHHARAFAAKRAFKVPLAQRALLIIASLALPVLLPSRVVVGILRKGRHLKELMKSLPYLLLLLTGWSYGEFCGYMYGEGAGLVSKEIESEG